MRINLYTTADETIKVDKTLTLVAEKDVDILGSANQSNITFTLAGNPAGVNYMYVPAWGRYYFIDAPTVLRNGLIEYSAHIDVLMTYKTQFRQDGGIIARQENNGNLFIADNDFPIEARNKIFFKEFPLGFDTGLTYYLTVGG